MIGTRRADNWRLRGPAIEACDIHDERGLAELFDRHQFAAVLNCEGTCKLKSCELDPMMARRVNIGGVKNLLRIIQGTSVRLVHMSVDLVFSGTVDEARVEDDPPDPVTVYGATMVEAERLILERTPGVVHSCAFRCRWVSASTVMREQSTGSSRDFRRGSQQRSITTRFVLPSTPIV